MEQLAFDFAIASSVFLMVFSSLQFIIIIFVPVRRPGLHVAHLYIDASFQNMREKKLCMVMSEGERYLCKLASANSVAESSKEVLRQL